MNIILIILIFIIVLFVYLHIFYHLRINNQLEVLKFDNLSKERLDELCNIRQPLIFELDLNCYEYLKPKNIKNIYDSFEINIRQKNLVDNNEQYIPFIFKKAKILLENDASSNYYSDSNITFLNETGLVNNFKSNDMILRPVFLMSSYYDYIIGSKDITTELKYDMSYRNFFIILQGSATFKMTPPKNTKFLYQNKNYNNLTFTSPLNLWNIQKEYINDFNKIKMIDTTLEPGKVIFIPAYWWYTIKLNTNDTVILNFKYNTYMNNIAILPHYIKHFLQKQHVQKQFI